jgi:hypothetical protein
MSHSYLVTREICGQSQGVLPRAKIWRTVVSLVVRLNSLAVTSLGLLSRNLVTTHRKHMYPYQSTLLSFLGLAR